MLDVESELSGTLSENLKKETRWLDIVETDLCEICDDMDYAE
jgi:hypothetical protein